LEGTVSNVAAFGAFVDLGGMDGLIHVSHDGGEHWENVTPSDLPEWALISIIEPSPHDPATAYVAATRYKLDDFHPYLYVTRDFGKSWHRIDQGIPEHEFTRVIREDPERAGLLICGTEQGVHVSFDAGAHWEPFNQNLPVVPIHDLVFKDADVVAATHGRSFWILDDIDRLRALYDHPELRDQDLALIPGRPTLQLRGGGRGFGADGQYGYLHSDAYLAQWVRGHDPVTDDVRTVALDAGANPPSGAVITYVLKEALDEKAELTLTITDPDGRQVATLSSAEPDKKAEGPKLPRLTKRAGSQSVVWNMRYPGATHLPGAVLWGGSAEGPEAPPGTYTLTLSAGERNAEGKLVIRSDPRLGLRPDEVKGRFELLMGVRDKLSQAHDTIIAVRSIREQVKAWVERAEGRPEHEGLKEEADKIEAELTSVEEALVQTKAKSSQDVLNFPVRLNAKLADVAHVIESAPGEPPRQAVETFHDLARATDAEVARFQELASGRVADFDQRIRSAGLPALHWKMPHTGEAD
ncbi:MAG: S1 RNA-binding domain-containing protein, partial [Clostridia bacterium]